MDRKWILISTVSLLVLLSGCQSESASSPKPEVESYPAGANETTITDPAALLESHQTSIQSTGYVLKKSGRRDGMTWNVTFRSSVRDERYSYNCTGKCFQGHSDSKFSYYQEGGNLFALERTERGRPAQTSYSVYEPREEFNATHVRFGTPTITHTLESNSTTKTSVFREGNHTYIRYAIQEPANSNKTINGSAVIREDGVVASYAIDGVEPDGDRFRLRIRIRPSPRSHVSPPAWKEKAEDAATIESDEIIGGSTGGTCNNDGDQSYDEDNDRDNDGVCDEG